MTHPDLAGRVVLITGAARGMGAAMARSFVGAGARVVLADVLAADGEALAKNLGEQAVYWPLDVSQERDWQRIVADTLARFARIDVLINNAGILQSGPLVSMTRDEFERVLQVNLIGPWLGIKTVAPVMVAAGGGAIINIASAAALVGMPGIGGYVASKWGLRGLTRSAAMELGPQGVRVNGIYPGGIDTPMANPTGAPAAQIDRGYAKQPIPRIGRPEEIAAACLFLASDAASYLCGAEIAVDGGMSAGVQIEEITTNQ
jgi:3alpha(or 20beta)-hydroxysteroid dehydrogenase